MNINDKLRNNEILNQNDIERFYKHYIEQQNLQNEVKNRIVI